MTTCHHSHSIGTAIDLARHGRTLGRRIILVVGRFEVLTPADVARVLAATTDDDEVVVGVEHDGTEAGPDLDDRMRLALFLVHRWSYGVAVPIEPGSSELTEAIKPDLVIDLD